jgi:hypothetical protein
MAVLPGERRLLRRRGEAAAAAVAQVRGSEEFGDGFGLGTWTSFLLEFFLPPLQGRLLHRVMLIGRRQVS